MGAKWIWQPSTSETSGFLGAPSTVLIDKCIDQKHKNSPFDQPPCRYTGVDGYIHIVIVIWILIAKNPGLQFVQVDDEAIKSLVGRGARPERVNGVPSAPSHVCVCVWVCVCVSGIKEPIWVCAVLRTPHPRKEEKTQRTMAGFPSGFPSPQEIWVSSKTTPSFGFVSKWGQPKNRDSPRGFRKNGALKERHRFVGTHSRGHPNKSPNASQGPLTHCFRLA